MIKSGGIKLRYQKKPVIVEAFKVGYDPMPDWALAAQIGGKLTIYYNDSVGFDKIYCTIQTLEGIMTCNSGDYIIMGARKELCLCKSDIFKETYEPIKNN